VLDFLRSGGRLTRDEAVYEDARLPRGLFAGAALAGVGYMKRVVDYGATVSPDGPDRFSTSLPNGLKFEADGGGFVDTMCMVAERFADDEYGWLDVAGHVVVDVGANIADSVLYFAKRGAAHVYGYEPNPAAHAAAARNLELNGVRDAEVAPLAVTGHVRDGGEVAFADVLDRARDGHQGLTVVCKIDCEGCEYDIFAPASLPERAFDRVSQVMIEYHFQPPDPIVTTLKDRGFQVETSAGAPGVGWIRARRPEAALRS
jgi:hypothetical protein